MTKLSIIIPVYNERLYLRRCLDSIKVAEADLHDVEIIVIDDASTDGSAEICDEYKDRVGFVVKHHKTNWGVSMARNHGLALASGDFVTFLDSDDEMSKDGVAHMLTGCLADHDVLQFNHYRVSLETNFCDVRYYNEPNLYRLTNLPRKWVLVWNKVYKLSFLNEHGIKFPEHVSFEEDRFFNIRVMRHQPEIYHAKAAVVLKHFDNKKSICHTVGRDEIFKISNALTQELKEDNSPELERVIRHCLAETWDSKTAVKLFGGEA